YHAAAAPAADEAGQVMLRFQDLMAKFLETQKAVMTTYLQGGAAPPDAAPPPAEFAPAPPRNGHSHAPEVPPAPAPEAPPPAPSANGDGRPDAPAANGEPAAAAQQQAKPDRDWFAARLQDLVSTRTGYPKEMLGLDLDLEADLGIDSIKRVEILGELAEMVEGAGTGGLGSNLEMEKLTSIKTLRGILDYLEEALGGAAGESPAAGPSANGEPDDRPRELEVQRALVRLVDAPLPARASLTLASGAVLFTDDGRGVAREMADRLADLGQKAVFLRAGEPRPDDGAGDVFHADLTDPDAVAEVVRQVRQQCGPVGGLVHLLPLAEPPQGETPAQRMRREVRSLYLLARELGEDLNRAADEGGAVLLSATALGGGLGFGDGPLPESYFAGHGGVIGFTKCLASEWPKVLARVVDVNLDAASPSEIAGRLLGELADANGPAEVGYLGARRVTWEPAAAPLDPSAEPALEIAPGSTILITGGARGITAAVALELARRHQPNLILVGRSPLPEESEPDDVAGLTEPGAVKAALIERLKREGRPVAPAAVESAYQRLTRDREIRGNIERMRQAGARVHYYQADVRDAAAMGRLLDEVAQRFGGIDGVVHGAGVIEDKLVKDKTPESFDRVFGTKVESALILREKLDPARLKFFALFASIASRYGNKGQSDYAAANEVLSKLAHELDRRWPCRVFSVAWGPWSGVGMVADLAKHLVARGLKLITTEEGPVFFADEIARGRKGEREVIIAGGAEHVVQPVRSGGKPAAELVK
ncbi:MAG TPA: SDR family NAD(P)-dependent oxidoreductase, partial [Gemmataceae bacterium]